MGSWVPPFIPIKPQNLGYKGARALVWSHWQRMGAGGGEELRNGRSDEDYECHQCPVGVGITPAPKAAMQRLWGGREIRARTLTSCSSACARGVESYLLCNFVMAWWSWSSRVLPVKPVVSACSP